MTEKQNTYDEFVCLMRKLTKERGTVGPKIAIGHWRAIATQKHIIKIISIPKGSDIPKEIRRGWIGLTIEVEGPVEMLLGSALRRFGGPCFGARLVYWTSSALALRALKYHNRESWEWFRRQKKLSPDFTFNAECCEVITE